MQALHRVNETEPRTTHLTLTVLFNADCIVLRGGRQDEEVCGTEVTDWGQRIKLVGPSGLRGAEAESAKS